MPCAYGLMWNGNGSMPNNIPSSLAKKDRSDEAKKILAEARAVMEEWYGDLSDHKRRQFKTNYKVNLKAVDEALAQFE